MPVADDRHPGGLEGELVEGCGRRTAEDELLDAKNSAPVKSLLASTSTLSAVPSARVSPTTNSPLGRLVQSVDEGVVAVAAIEVVGAAAALNRVVTGEGVDVVGDRVPTMWSLRATASLVSMRISF